MSQIVKKEKNYDVIIIGAGSAGLSARSIVSKYTDNYLLFDSGPLGTTCARTGCMPAKAFLEISQKESDSKKALAHVRKLRDYFVESVVNSFEKWSDHFVNEEVKFKDDQTILAGGKEYKAKSFIVAVGSRPVIPKKWKDFSDFLITTDSLFNMEKLPSSIAVIGLGPVGLETAQALSRFPIKIKGYSDEGLLSHFQDMKIQEYAQKYFSSLFSLQTDKRVDLEVKHNKIFVKTKDNEEEFDKIFLSIGRKSNIDRLNLGDNVLDEIDEETLSLSDRKHIYIVGDSNNKLPILHEASFEGEFAAKHIFKKVKKIQRKVPLSVIYTKPQACLVGDISGDKIGEVSFEDQGRSRLKGENFGMAKVFFDKDMVIKGAKLFCPDAEYLGHFLALAIDQKLTQSDLLNIPYYHPSVMEGLRTAIQDAQ